MSAGLLQALLEFQKEAPTLARDATNPHFRNKYVSLDSLTQTVTPLLCKHGLVWTAMPCRDDGEPSLRYRLAHAASGEAIEGSMPLMITKADPQGQGSALTYARRYAISAVLGLSAEDDDGNGASRPGRQQAARPPLVGTETMAELRAAAKGLKFGDVKLAMTACGIDVTQVRAENVFSRVPADKAAELARMLAEADR